MKIGTGSTAKVFRFSYDASGNVVSADYSTDNGTNFTTYYYLRNAQNDIVKIIDGSGNTVVEYTYDSWGKPISVTGSLAGTLGEDQPFRYRGYVYDSDTLLYYLQSRYYDPKICRFISADVLLSTGQGVLGHNSFAYCINNPVNMVDDGGAKPKDLVLISEEGGGGTLYDYSDLPRYFEYGEEQQALDALNAGYTVYYRDTELVWISGKPFKSSCSFLGEIHIYKGQTFEPIDLKHEYGHIVQEKLLGERKYLIYIALPSAANCDKFGDDLKGYYSQMWEYTADMFGGVERPFAYEDGAREKALAYFYMALFSL